MGKKYRQKYSCIKKGFDQLCFSMQVTLEYKLLSESIFTFQTSVMLPFWENQHIYKNKYVLHLIKLHLYTLFFFILGKKACCLDREKSQNPLVKCKICRRSDILNFSCTILTVNDVTEESQGSHPKGGISGKLVKAPLIY